MLAELTVEHSSPPSLQREALHRFDPLADGDSIAVVSLCASPTALTEKGISVIEEAGFTVVRPDLPQIRMFPSEFHNRYEAYPREVALSVLLETFKDPAIKAVMFSSGRTGSELLLPLISDEVIAELNKHPTLVIGQGNPNLLLTKLAHAADFPTAFGPWIDSLGRAPADALTQRALNNFLRGVPGVFQQGIALEPLHGSDTSNRSDCSLPVSINNLTLLASLCGTAHFPDLNDKIVIVEEEGELPRRIYSTLVQLSNTGRFNPAALIFADMIHCFDTESNSNIEVRNQLMSWMQTVQPGFPVYKLDSQFPLGQGTDTLCCGIGVQAEIHDNRLYIDSVFKAPADPSHDPDASTMVRECHEEDSFETLSVSLPRSASNSPPLAAELAELGIKQDFLFDGSLFGSDVFTKPDAGYARVAGAVQQYDFESQGYNQDPLSRRCQEEVLKAILGTDHTPPNAHCVFVPSGTAAAALVTTLNKPASNSVIVHSRSHGYTRDRGAHGHVIAADEGKPFLEPDTVASLLRTYNPPTGMSAGTRVFAVEITTPTEDGHVYTPERIRALSDVCHQYGAILIVDGARIWNALASVGSSLNEYLNQSGVDALTIGGTKVGMTFGEAAVFLPSYFENVSNAPTHDGAFAWQLLESVKHHGHLFPRSYVTGVQFLKALKEDYAIENAALSNTIASKAYALLRFYHSELITAEPPESNSLLVTLPGELKESLLSYLPKIRIDNSLNDPTKFVARFIFSHLDGEAQLYQFSKLLGRLYPLSRHQLPNI